jgi:hypothetical protein
VIGKNWDNVLLKHRDVFMLKGDLNLLGTIKEIDESLAFVVPFISNEDVYPYSLLAFDRGIPYITTKQGLSGLLARSASLHNPFSIEISNAENAILLAKSPPDFIRIIKNLANNKDLWKKYSNLITCFSLRHFGKYRAAIRIDNIFRLHNL